MHRREGISNGISDSKYKVFKIIQGKLLLQLKSPETNLTQTNSLVQVQDL